MNSCLRSFSSFTSQFKTLEVDAQRFHFFVNNRILLITFCPKFQFRSAIDAHNDYKRRCNAFFMEMIARLCFTRNTAPEDAVIKKLLNYVTKELKAEGQAQLQTRNLTPFEDCIDPTPVVRSFLLQLLLKSK